MTYFKIINFSINKTQKSLYWYDTTVLVSIQLESISGESKYVVAYQYRLFSTGRFYSSIQHSQHCEYIQVLYSMIKFCPCIYSNDPVSYGEILPAQMWGIL